MNQIILRVTLENYSTKVIDRHHYLVHPTCRQAFWILDVGTFFTWQYAIGCFSFFLYFFALSFSSLSRKLRQNLCDNRHLESSLLLSYRVTHIPRELEENRPSTKFHVGYRATLYFLSTFSFVLDLRSLLMSKFCTSIPQ